MNGYVIRHIFAGLYHTEFNEWNEEKCNARIFKTIDEAIEVYGQGNFLIRIEQASIGSGRWATGQPKKNDKPDL